MSNSVVLVNAINEGVLQTAENARLKNLVESCAEAAYVASGMLHSSLRQIELDNSLNALFDALKKAEQISYTKLVRPNTSSYSLEARQDLSASELAEGCGSVIPSPDPALPRSDGKTLTADAEEIIPKLESHGAPERIIDLVRTILAQATATNYPSQRRDGDRCHAEVAAEGAWATLLRSVISALVSVVTPDAIARRFEDANEALRRATFDAADAAARQDASFEEGNIGDAVAMFDGRLELAARRQEYATQKLELTEDALAAYVRAPASALAAAAATVASGVDARLAAAQAYDERVAADVARLRASVDAVETADADALAAYAAEAATLDREVSDLRSEIAAVMAAIVDGEAHMKNLSRDIATRCLRRVALHERELVRREECAAFAHWAAAQREALAAAAQSVEEERARSDAVEATVAECAQAAMREVRAAEEALVGVRDEALSEFHEAFRDRYMTLGDYMYRTERATDGLRTRAEQAAMQQQIAIDSGRSDVKPLADERKRLEAEFATSHAKLEALRGQLSALEPVYTPVADAMQQRGIVRQHPAEELTASLNARRMKLVEYKAIADMTAPSQRAQLEREKAAIEAAHAELALLREAAERRQLLAPPTPALPAPPTM